jgi:hypothetical protein
VRLHRLPSPHFASTGTGTGFISVGIGSSNFFAGRIRIDVRGNAVFQFFYSGCHGGWLVLPEQA